MNASSADAERRDEEPSELRLTVDERARKLVGGLKDLKDRVVGPWRRGRSLLEIQRSIVDDVGEHVAEIGGGRRVFPYRRVEADLRFATDEERAVAVAALEAGWGDELRRRIESRLDEARCVPRELEIAVEVLEEPAPVDGPFHALRFHRAATDAEGREPAAGSSVGAATGSPPNPGRPTLVLGLRVGLAEEEIYRLNQERILIGRLRDVLDHHGRIKRRNDVAFLDDQPEGDENQTVSREHARIVYRDEPRGYWLADERSAYGTRIFRDGRPIDVSSRDRRGVRLKDGDEIYLGRAVLRCEIVASD